MKKAISFILVLTTLLSLVSMIVISTSAKSVDNKEKLFEFSWEDEKHSNKHETLKTIKVFIETRKCFIGYQTRLRLTHEIVCVPYDWFENEERIEDKNDHYTEYYWSYKNPLTIEEICIKDSYLRENEFFDKLKILYQCQKALKVQFSGSETMLKSLKSEITDNIKNDITYSIIDSIKSSILSFLGLDATNEVIDRANTAGTSAMDATSPPSFIINFFNELGIQIDTMTIAMEKALKEIDSKEGSTTSKHKALLILTANNLYDIILNIS